MTFAQRQQYNRVGRWIRIYVLTVVRTEVLPADGALDPAGRTARRAPRPGAPRRA